MLWRTRRLTRPSRLLSCCFCSCCHESWWDDHLPGSCRGMLGSVVCLAVVAGQLMCCVTSCAVPDVEDCAAGPVGRVAGSPGRGCGGSCVVSVPAGREREEKVPSAAPPGVHNEVYSSSLMGRTSGPREEGPPWLQGASRVSDSSHTPAGANANANATGDGAI